MADNKNDEQEIRNLLERYTYAVNTRNWNVYRDCWASDAVWQLGAPVNGKHNGIEDIMKEVTKTVEGLELFIQMTHAITITEINDDRAKAVVTLNEIGKPLPETKFPFPSMFILALYYDDLIKQDGKWKFAKRNYKVAYWDSELLKGDVHQQEWIHKAV